jgi:3-dehydroquinate dehydratase-2
MAGTRHIAVLHGVNLDMLGQRDPAQYGTLTLAEVCERVAGFADELGFSTGFFQTNFEGEFVERLHALRGEADAIILNPGAWTHYSYAIRDALEIAALPSVEVHLSDIKAREPWRAVSVVQELCVASFAGSGVDGYRMALERLGALLDGPDAGAEASA